MGIYVIGPDELEEKLEELLMNIEGDVYADVMAEAWNRLAKKYGWDERLKVAES